MFLKRLLLLSTMGLIAIATLSISVAATQSTPYSGYGVRLHDSSKATASITKCSCNPVNNYLAARCMMQYQNGGQYTDTPWSTWDTGTNVASAGISWGTSSGTSTFAWGEYKARCSGGTQVSLSSTT